MFAESNVVNKIFLCVPEFEIITVYNMGIRYLQCLLWDYCIMEKKNATNYCIKWSDLVPDICLLHIM